MFGKHTQSTGEVHKLGKPTPLGETPQENDALPSPDHGLLDQRAMLCLRGSVFRLSVVNTYVSDASEKPKQRSYHHGLC